MKQLLRWLGLITLEEHLTTLAREKLSLTQHMVEQVENETWQRAVTIATGCHDYMGGFTNGVGYQAFQAGVGTVVAVLRKMQAGEYDSQLAAVEQHGAHLEAKKSPSLR